MDPEEARMIEAEMKKLLKSAVASDKRRGGQRAHQRRKSISRPFYRIADDLSEDMQFKPRHMAVYHENHEVMRFTFKELVGILAEFGERITDADRASLHALHQKICAKSK